MPRVYNGKNKDAPHGAVYVGRPSKWGNPYVEVETFQRMSYAKQREGHLMVVPTREDAVESYHSYLQTRPDLMESLHELIGKDLICWCAPQVCHADILLRYANGD